jgi:hypothetical protein
VLTVEALAMNFKDVVEATPNLKGAWKVGLGALRAVDKPHIQAEDTRRLTGSADIDKALEKKDPQAHRWDFAIAYQHTNRKLEYIYWVEIHTGSHSEVSFVLNKLRWLRGWLKTDGKELAEFEREFIWISSGATTFSLNAPKKKQFALLGLQHKGKVLKIPDTHPD